MTNPFKPPEFQCRKCKHKFHEKCGRHYHDGSHFCYACHHYLLHGDTHIYMQPSDCHNFSSDVIAEHFSGGLEFDFMAKQDFLDEQLLRWGFQTPKMLESNPFKVGETYDYFTNQYLTDLEATQRKSDLDLAVSKAETEWKRTVNGIVFAARPFTLEDKLGFHIVILYNTHNPNQKRIEKPGEMFETPELVRYISHNYQQVNMWVPNLWLKRFLPHSIFAELILQPRSHFLYLRDPEDAEGQKRPFFMCVSRYNICVPFLRGANQKQWYNDVEKQFYYSRSFINDNNNVEHYEYPMEQHEVDKLEDGVKKTLMANPCQHSSDATPITGSMMSFPSNVRFSPPMNKSIMLRYPSSGRNICSLSSLSSAVHYHSTQTSDKASQRILKLLGHHLIQTQFPCPPNATFTFKNISSFLHNYPSVKVEFRSWNFCDPLKLDYADSSVFYLSVIRGIEQSSSHVVTFFQNHIFDGNIPYAIPLSVFNLAQCTSFGLGNNPFQDCPKIVSFRVTPVLDVQPSTKKRRKR